MSKPDYLPLWATEDTTLPATGQTNKVRPKESLRTIGWDMGQIPTAEEWNWQFNNMYQWIEYFSEFYASATDSATANTLALRDSTGSLHFYNLYTDNDLSVTGDSALSGSLSVTGTSSLSGNITSSGVNSWTGANTFSADSTFSGDTSITSATIEGLTVSGASAFESAITSGGNNTWAGTQSFQGNITSSGDNMWEQENTFSGDVTFSGAITSKGTNTFSGVNTFSSQLNLQSSNLSTNGYTYLPNGLIMQWGTSNRDGDSTLITYPLSFPNNSLSVTITLIGTSSGDSTDNPKINTISKTGFILSSQAAEDSFYWQAIGH